MVLFVVGFACVGRVYRENTYTSATIEIHAGQRVIDTGPYAIVRHPMYAGALLHSPVAIPTPIVTAGFKWALLPTASATMTAQITASPHAVVITIQPPFSA